ncbi:MAG: FUSC family protein [Solirubrobacteraceae bacterium]
MSSGPLRGRIDVSRSSESARRRVLDSFTAVLQASVAAALAWLFAHRVLGHPQPFFAPVAAAISLSTSRIQRSRRIAQMVAGVLLGIGVAEVLHALLGSSTAALGVIVLVTMLISLAVGVGFFGDGLMFPNQAAVSAVLVVTVHRHGTGGERAIDVLVGGAVAYLLGVVLFPAQPMSLLADAEDDVLRTLAGKLDEVVALLGSGEDASDAWTLATGHDIHRRLAALARARATARLSVRVAPRRFRLRTSVDGEVTRTGRLDLLANAVLSLIRAATLRSDGRNPPPAALRERIASLAGGLASLAGADRPWASALVQEVEHAALDTVEHVSAQQVDTDQVVASILRATARDLVAVIEPHALSE